MKSELKVQIGGEVSAFRVRAPSLGLSPPGVGCPYSRGSQSWKGAERFPPHATPPHTHLFTDVKT